MKSTNFLLYRYLYSDEAVDTFSNYIDNAVAELAQDYLEKPVLVIHEKHKLLSNREYQDYVENHCDLANRLTRLVVSAYLPFLDEPVKVLRVKNNEFLIFQGCMVDSSEHIFYVVTDMGRSVVHSAFMPWKVLTKVLYGLFDFPEERCLPQSA